MSIPPVTASLDAASLNTRRLNRQRLLEAIRRLGPISRADLAKHHLLVLWTDYFKPAHLEKYPELHELFWKAAKTCSFCKQEVRLEHCQELMDHIKRVHEIFWETKGKETFKGSLAPELFKPTKTLAANQGL